MSRSSSLPRFDLGDAAGETDRAPFSVEPLRDFIVPLRESGSGGIFLLPAGRRGGDDGYAHYADQVRSFDWDEFYLRWRGEAFFDWFREEALSVADVVLVDSRTGITELSGVCTFHLADAVVMLVAPSRQNLEGCALIAESLRRPGLVEQGRRGRALKVLAVPARIDHSESDQVDEFAIDFSKQLEPFVERGLHFENSLFIDLKVPYVPTYAFRERIAVTEPDRVVATDMIAAYQRLASTLVELAPVGGQVARIFHGGPLRPDRSEAGAGLPAGFVPRPWALDRIQRWLDETDEPLLIITGEPGSGKTTLARWIADLMEPDGRRNSPGLPARLLYELSTDGRGFVEELARRLADVVGGYAVALRHQRSRNIVVDVKQQISATGGGGALLGEVSVSQVSPNVAFDELVRRPLNAAELSEPLLVLVDGLETTASQPPADSLGGLLAHITTSRASPLLRFVVTSRPDPRVLNGLSASRFDLMADDPRAERDIRLYIDQRLKSLSVSGGPEQRQRLLHTVALRSEGNFAYAEMVLSSLADDRYDPSQLPVLPDGIAAAYRHELNRVLGSDPSVRGQGAAVLGALAVARAPLTRVQLAGIVKWPLSKVDETLEHWGQFLTMRPDGSVELFHRSFAEYLLSDETFGIYADEANAAIVRYLLEEAEAGWISMDAEYGLRHILAHVFAGVSGSRDRSVRQAAVVTAAQLLSDPQFLTAKVSRLGFESLVEDIVAGARTLAPLSRIPTVRHQVTAATDQLVHELSETVGGEVLPGEVLGRLSERMAATIVQIYADAYSDIRDHEPPSAERTTAMNALVNEVRQLAGRGFITGLDLGALLTGSDGQRLIALATLQVQPDPSYFEAVCDAIGNSRSAFEQYHALDVVARVLPLLSEPDRRHLLAVLDAERRDVRGLGVMRDTSRGPRIMALLGRLLDEEAQVTGHNAVAPGSTSVQIEFRYETGLRQSRFTGATLTGSWTPDGWPSPSSWATLPMQPMRCADGSAGFTATVSFDIGAAGAMFSWGVHLECTDGSTVWGIFAETPDDSFQYRSFILEPGARLRRHAYRLSWHRCRGAQRWLVDGAEVDAIRFSVWARTRGRSRLCSPTRAATSPMTVMDRIRA
jgi:energy-coupling factor transporter ATP-binding protein EcfA2